MGPGGAAQDGQPAVSMRVKVDKQHEAQKEELEAGPEPRAPALKRARHQGRCWQQRFCVLLPDKKTLTHFPSEDIARRCLHGRLWGADWERVLPEEDEGPLSETGSLRDDRLLSCCSPPEAAQERGSDELRQGGSATSTPILGGRVPDATATPSRIVSFFSKRSLKQNPLKRTKSVSKLERARRAEAPTPRLRGSRSHESLLQSPGGPWGLEGARLGPLHPSLRNHPAQGQAWGPAPRGAGEHWFELAPRGGPACVYACRSRQQCLHWLARLRQAAQPQRDAIRRTENALRLWVLEAKGLAPKKRYFCELRLDGTLYARTSAKLKSQLCFWGEHFEFSHLPAVNTLTVTLFREADRRKRRDKSVALGMVTVPLVPARAHHVTEKWYPLVPELKGPPTPGTKETTPPSVRLKWRYQSLEVQPLASYQPFLQYLKRDYGPLCRLLEPVLGVRLKEEIATGLVSIMHREEMAQEFLTQLVMADLQDLGDQHLTFRGNSLATKATEAYLKLLGDGYLQDTLGPFIRDVLASNLDCEVDPAKVSGGSGALQRQQVLLRQRVQQAWQRITQSAHSFPRDLRMLFHGYRQRLGGNTHEEELCDNLISGSIFLRCLCPAILSPSLFGLAPEYPDERAARSLTLIAKTIQTLANFTRFGGKESFMEFMNDFVEKEWSTMKTFLKVISSPVSTEQNSSSAEAGIEIPCVVDLGLELAQLQMMLRECLPQLEGKEGEAALRAALDGRPRSRGQVLSCLEANPAPAPQPRSSTLPRSALAPSTTIPRELPRALPDLLTTMPSGQGPTAVSHVLPPQPGGCPPLAFSNPVYRWGGLQEPQPESLTGGESGSSGHSSAAESEGSGTSSPSSPHLWEDNFLAAAGELAGRSRESDERFPHRSLREYEREVAQLKRLMGQLQRKLSLAETQLQQQQQHPLSATLGADSTEEQQQRRQEKDLQMKSIITRLITVEDELRREQREMQGMIRAKQQLIDAQERKIQTLDAANQRLLGALAQLRQHYQDQVQLEPRLLANGASSPPPPSYRSSSC
ncbi:ras GTPase-activating protein nGAP isoform X5 [Dermacentor albipictus]|uniref:ras GTPase-activating protein nGAP isoform X5 n=1 Tax=Dermacentor albipictus TaxID=60249 RepID=UPI0031FD3905